MPSENSSNDVPGAGIPDWTSVSDQDLLDHLITLDYRGRAVKKAALAEYVRRGATQAARDLASNSDHIPIIAKIIVHSMTIGHTPVCP